MERRRSILFTCAILLKWYLIKYWNNKKIKSKIKYIKLLLFLMYEIYEKCKVYCNFCDNSGQYTLKTRNIAHVFENEC